MGEASYGKVGHITDLGGTNQFIVLGPFAAGTVLISLRLQLSAIGTAGGHVVTLGAVYGGSKEGSLIAFNAGTSLVHVSNVGFGEKRAVRAQFDATGGQRTFELPVGVRVQRGSVYVIVGVVSGEADADTDLTASVSTSVGTVSARGGEPSADSA